MQKLGETSLAKLWLEAYSQGRASCLGPYQELTLEEAKKKTENWIKTNIQQR